MRMLQILVLILLTMLVSINVMAENVTTKMDAVAIDWQTYSSEIFEKAKLDKHTVMLLTVAEACKWCKKMEETTLQDPTVAQFINDNFYPVILHVDLDNETADRYNIEALPTIIYFNLSGKEVNRSEGYIESADMLTFMQKMATDVSKK